MSELAYLFCAENDRTGDMEIRFAVWLAARRIPRDVIDLEVQAFRDTLDVLAVSGP